MAIVGLLEFSAIWRILMIGHENSPCAGAPNGEKFQYPSPPPENVPEDVLHPGA